MNFKHLQSQRLVWWLLGITIVILLGSYYQRYIFSDDAWLGEQAYWLAKDGVVRSELFRGRGGYEIQKLIYHKLWIWQGALMIKGVGWQLWGLKALSLCYLIGFVVMSYFYFRSQNLLKDWWIFLLLLLSYRLVVQASFIFRPEIMLMLLGWCSFWGLRNAMAHAKERKKIINRKELQYALWSGGMAGLAMLGHLYGLIFVMAGGISLLIAQKWRATLVFGMAAMIGFSPFFVDVVGNWALFQEQLFGDFAAKSASGGFSFSVGLFLNKLLMEQSRFLHSEAEIALTATAVVSMLLARKAIMQHPVTRFHLGYLLWCILFLALIAHDKTTKYVLLYLPHLLLLTAFAVRHSSLWLRGLLGIFLIINWSLVIFKDYPKNYSQERGQIHQMQRFDIPEGAKIIAPIEFIFPNIKNYNIKGLKYYAVLMNEGEAIDWNYITEDAQKMGYDYIILNQWYFEKLQLQKEETTTETSYSLLQDEGGYFYFVNNKLRHR